MNDSILSYEEQVEYLSSRGLALEPEICFRYLQTINFYRFLTYSDHFIADQSEKFKEGTSFNHVLEIYRFDRHLRRLLFEAIERIEVSFRNQLIQNYSLTYGEHWYADINLYSNHSYFLEVISNVKYQLPKNKNNRSKKKRAKYIVTLPPAAKILDGVSFGVLSKIFAGLAHSDTKIKIANYYQLPDPIILSSWLHSINTVRNICAHHGQLWNKRLQPTPFNLSNRKLSSNWLEYKIQDNTSEKLYLVTCCICYLLRQVNPRTQFASDLKSIFERFPHTPLEPIGFPLNWQSDRFWNLNLVLSNK